MRNKKIWLVLLVLPLLVANYVWAQGLPSGTLNGRVDDEAGAGLPGVSVTATSPALQGSRTTVTNVNGDYVIPNLPPGDYTVTIAVSGFQTVTRTPKVSSGQQNVVNVKLAMAGVTTGVTVIAQSEAISQTSQASTTYSGDLMNKLPVGRTIIGSVILTPGVNQNGPAGNVTITGGQSFDNVFTVNGVNIQDNVRGTPTNLFIEDAVQEITTMTSGVSAEYGRFTGGVVNVVTKRGGNSFSGSFRVTMNNDNNRAETPIHTTYTDKWVPTYEATLGGPIWPDKIWFFGSGRYNKQETSGSTNAIVPGGPTISIPQTNLNERVEGKLTITPFQSQTLTGSYLWTTTEAQNYYFPNLPVLDLKQTYNRETPSDLLAINYNGVITSNFFLEAQYSKKKFTFINSGGTDTSLIGGTALGVLDHGYGVMWSPVFCGVCSPESRDNNDYEAKGTYFLSSPSLGSHNIAFGYQNFGQQRMSNNYQSGSNWWLYPTSVKQVGADLYPIIDASSYFVYFPIPNLSQGSDLRTSSVFVNDQWKLGNNLSFNIGIRWDKNNATDSAGHLVANDSQFSPRLSVSYDIAGDGKFRVSGSYARYVGQIQETIAGSGATSAGSPASYYYYWNHPGQNEYNTGSTLTPTDQILKEMFANLGVNKVGMFPLNFQADAVNLPGVNLQIINPLKSPNANEYSLGFGGTLGRIVYRVDAVRREFKDFYMTQRDRTTGFVSDDLGNPYNLGVFVNSNLPERNYTALNTAIAYRTGPLSVGGNWTWSHTLGNFVGEGAGGGPASSGLLNYPEYFQQSWTAPRGDLSQDQRHRVRIYANYDFLLGPVTISPGLVQAFDTGTPYGAAGGINSSPYVALGCKTPGIDQTKCYLAPPTSVTYWFTSRDAYRTDNIYRTDLSLNFSAKIGPVELFVQPQVFNVFNGQGVTFVNNPTAINTSVNTGKLTTVDARGLVRFNPFTTAPIECPQGDTKAQCTALGANWQKSAQFGTPTSGSATAPSFQAPRTYLVTLGVRF
jgi:outer membrane receptor protein involved in Fe transport